MNLVEGVFPLLMLVLITLFAAGVAADHDGARRRGAPRAAAAGRRSSSENDR